MGYSSPMKYFSILFITILFSQSLHAQVLSLKSKRANALSGSEFATSIADSTFTLAHRENLIFSEIKKGNVPDFLRKLTAVTDSAKIDGKIYSITYYVLPDYLAIGSNKDFFYVPMTPILAQKIAELVKCSLPTKRIVDAVYKAAEVKLEPQPIPPTASMTIVPVFMAHNSIVQKQLSTYLAEHALSALTAGHKKDIVISNKIYGQSSNRVVIYGWHQLDGKAIQPLYNKHSNTWADYSHGVRLVQQKVWLNGKKTSLAKVLADPKLNVLLSDEGVILKPFYPITNY